MTVANLQYLIVERGVLYSGRHDELVLVAKIIFKTKSSVEY